MQGQGNTLTQIKEELSNLKPGETVKIHESRIAQGLQAERQPIGAHPSAQTLFVAWCVEHGLVISYNAIADHIWFKKLADAR